MRYEVLSEILNVLQSKTSTISSKSSELLEYVRLMESLKIRVDDKEGDDIKTLIFNSFDDISNVERKLQQVSTILESLDKTSFLSNGNGDKPPF